MLAVLLSLLFSLGLVGCDGPPLPTPQSLETHAALSAAPIHLYLWH
jgi:hypothetical protein